mmetsp:Transcript_24440/g.37028  ORF Transcript_24440/g.37028 Transcript_24440/m.37028 type:complete len:126 (+) Transcript_24440:3-380(+)|eukprot:scaffold6113_cov112-Skeletonema_dohrnii-CCMP3373.AAC.2
MMKLLLLILPFLPFLEAFAPCPSRSGVTSFSPRSLGVDRHQQLQLPVLNMKIDKKRRKELGLPEDADEYDLDVALNNNTDAGITKIIAGSFILVMLALLVVGLVIPSITDYGDGVCSPIQNGGRC